jgi:TRAP-type C4-dicarboxylate transport system permease small subunit
MSRRSRRRVAVALILVLFGLAASWGYIRWQGRPRDVAPAFALPASTGQTVRLEEFRGKQPVVLAFFMVGT